MIPIGADLVFLIGAILTIAYIGGRVSNRLKLPEVTGYLFAGILLKAAITWIGVIPPERFDMLLTEHLGQIPQITLAMIAFVIGGSLPIEQLKRLGRGIAWIGLTEGFGAFVMVGVLTYLLAPFVWSMPIVEGVTPTEHILAFALLLGALSSATAPAATVAVIRELRAKGDVTTTLLGVVGLDDAVALFIFTFASAIASGLLAGAEQASVGVISTLVVPLIDVLGSAILGTAMGFLAHYGSRLFRSKRETIVGGLGFVLLSGGIAVAFGLSPLFTNMLAGFTLINLSARNMRFFRSLEDIEAPIYAVFFALAGTHLAFEDLGTLGALSAIYILARLGGKVFGVKIGAKLGGASQTVSKYLGLGLVPQAGVAIGLVLLVKDNPAFASFAPVMTNIILGTVAVNEIIGPPFTAYALRKAGETHSP
ncbi:MAG: cation:proton antiporter [Candidatus Coatesbacteria bacterium]|nr:cation:proton antiporter [Candidatus Coatesbacteria bacterium]